MRRLSIYDLPKYRYTTTYIACVIIYCARKRGFIKNSDNDNDVVAICISVFDAEHDDEH